MSHLKKKLFPNLVSYPFRTTVTYKEVYNRVYVYDELYLYLHSLYFQ